MKFSEMRVSEQMYEVRCRGGGTPTIHQLKTWQEKVQKLEALLDITNPWITSMLPNTYRCQYCKEAVRGFPTRDTLLSHHKDNCIFVKALKES